MRALWAAAGLVLAMSAILAAVSLIHALRLRARHRRLARATAPPPSAAAEMILDSPRALYHGTRFHDGWALLLPAFREPCVGDLSCTTDALSLRREQEGGGAGLLLVIPLAWIEGATLVRGHAPLAGRDLPILRLRWRWAGELLISEFSLRGGMAQLERLRREIHLRQGGGMAREQLARFLFAPAEAEQPRDRKGGG